MGVRRPFRWPLCRPIQCRCWFRSRLSIRQSIRFMGQAELEPAMSLQQALDGDSAVVADEFLIRLNAHVGETLRLGGREFQNYRGAAAGARSHDQRGAGIGPRVMISHAALDRTGLLAPGSRASQRLLVKLPPKARSWPTVRKAD